MTMKDEHKLITKAKLTDDDVVYLAARNTLRQLRDEYQASRDEHSEDPAEDDGEGLDEAEDSDDEDALSPEEWVASASKAEIVAELRRRKVEHDPKNTKDVLGAQLVAAVQE